VAYHHVANWHRSAIAQESSRRFLESSRSQGSTPFFLSDIRDQTSYYTFAVLFKEKKRTGEGGQTSRLSLFFFFIGQTGRLSSLFSKNCESIALRRYGKSNCTRMQEKSLEGPSNSQRSLKPNGSYSILVIKPTKSVRVMS
jgi:hypothetical protein